MAMLASVNRIFDLIEAIPMDERVYALAGKNWIE
jgi:hypothetical protein